MTAKIYKISYARHHSKYYCFNLFTLHRTLQSRSSEYPHSIIRAMQNWLKEDLVPRPVLTALPAFCCLLAGRSLTTECGVHSHLVMIPL